MKIGIAGAGGIGSNVARYLVQSGMTDLLVLDFDLVERANLNRQFFSLSQEGRPKVDCLRENLQGINPRVTVTAIHKRLEPGQAREVFSGCSIVVEGFDDPKAKKALVEDLSPMKIPLICASGIAGRQMETVRVRTLGNLHVVGDFSTDIRDDLLFPPKIGLITAMMAGLVLDLAGWPETRMQNER